MTAHNADDIERVAHALDHSAWAEAGGTWAHIREEHRKTAVRVLDAVSDRIAARALADATERIEKARAAYIAEHPGTQKPQHWDTQHRDYEGGVVDGFTLAARAADLGETP